MTAADPVKMVTLPAITEAQLKALRAARDSLQVESGMLQRRANDQTRGRYAETHSVKVQCAVRSSNLLTHVAAIDVVLAGIPSEAADAAPR